MDMIKITENKNFYTIVVSIILLLYAISAFLLFNPQLFQGGDNIVYMILSKSIMQYHKYADLHLEGTPAHTKYPFGYPLLLGLWSFISHNTIWMKILSVLLGAIGIFFISKIIRKNATLFIAVSLLTIFNPYFMIYTSRILSEIPFFAFFAIGIYTSGIWYKEGMKSYKFYLMILLSIIPFYIRSIGIVIPLSIGLILLKDREYKRLLIYSIGIVVLIAPWYIRNALVATGGETYFKQFFMQNPYDESSGMISFTGFLMRIKHNIDIYLKVISMLFFTSTNIIIGLGILLISIVGLMKMIKEHTILGLSLIFYYLLLHLWPDVWSSDRFLIAVYPFIAFAFVYGIYTIFKNYTVNYDYIYMVIVIVSLITLSSSYKKEYGHASYIRATIKTDKLAGFRDDWKNYIKAAKWAKDNTDERSVFIVRKPEFFYAFSGRQCLLYPFTSDVNKEIKFLEKNKKDYIVVDNFYWTGTTHRYLIPALLKIKTQYVTIQFFDGPPTYILRHIDYAYSAHNDSISAQQ